MPRTLMHDGLFLEFSPGADAEAFLRRCERHVEAALDERVHLAIKAPPEPQCLPALVAQMDSEFSIQNNKLEDAGALALFSTLPSLPALDKFGLFLGNRISFFVRMRITAMFLLDLELY